MRGDACRLGAVLLLLLGIGTALAARVPESLALLVVACVLRACAGPEETYTKTEGRRP